METTSQTIMDHGILQDFLGSCVDVKWATGNWSAQHITSETQEKLYYKQAICYSMTPEMQVQ